MTRLIIGALAVGLALTGALAFALAQTGGDGQHRGPRLAVQERRERAVHLRAARGRQLARPRHDPA